MRRFFILLRLFSSLLWVAPASLGCAGVASDMFASVSLSCSIDVNCCQGMMIFVLLSCFRNVTYQPERRDPPRPHAHGTTPTTNFAPGNTLRCATVHGRLRTLLPHTPTATYF